MRGWDRFCPPHDAAQLEIIDGWMDSLTELGITHYTKQ